MIDMILIKEMHWKKKDLLNKCEWGYKRNYDCIIINEIDNITKMNGVKKHME